MTLLRRVPVAVVAGAVILRLPAFLATRHLSFDDGVYGASALAMRDGAAPFRDVFSSQGPLFLPLVWVADLVGLRTLDAPRLLAVAAGAVLVAAVWTVARGAGCGRLAAGAGAALVATSGSVLWVTGPLTSDGPALALATVAVALALSWRRAPALRTAVLCGLAMGAALSVKSLLVAAAVPVGLVLVRRPRHLAAAVVASVAVALAVSLPWGLADVWDQSVAYHLEAAGSRTPVANAGKVITTLLDRDLPVAMALGGAALVAVWARFRQRPAPEPETTRLVAGWLAATAVVLLLEHPLWRNHVAHLVPAGALLVALALERAGPVLGRRAAVALGAAVAVAVPYHVVHMDDVLWPRGPRGAEAAARADLSALPARAWAFSDEPGLVARTGRHSPPDLVDGSVLRIDSGRITATSLAAAAADSRVCAVLVWSSRFGRFTELPRLLTGYREAAAYGGPRVLYLRDPCRP
ncbi:MAG: hypothetical protein ACRDZ7_12375 [Acidimicrobiia bacterium]